METFQEDPGLNIYFKDIARTDLLTREQEYELARRTREGDKEAEDSLVTANLRFVVSIAKRYQNQGLTFDELIQEGNIGLMTAAKRFDERRGFRFTSYVVWWIRQSITRAIADQAKTIRLPVNRVDLIRKINMARREYYEEHKKEPQDFELMEYGGFTTQQFRTYRELINQEPSSLDKTLTEDGDTTPLDIQDLGGYESPDEAVSIEQGKNQVYEIRRKILWRRERTVIALYYGLADPELGIEESEGLTLEEVGDRIGVTRERVRQIKEQAHEKLRGKRKTLDDSI